MAQHIGGLAASHIPSIGNAIAKGLHQDPYWQPFFDGFPPIHRWLDGVKPDVAVVFYNDHGLNFFLDKMPTFAIGAAPEYRNADAVRGLVYGEAAAVQYSSYALMMLVRLDPLDADTLDSLRAQALSDMKSGELQDSIQSYGAQLSHALDSAAMKKMPASKIKNEQ